MGLNRETLLVGSALGMNNFNGFMTKRTEHRQLNGHVYSLLSNLG